MKYLRKFNTEADVQVFVKPNVVLIEDTGKVLYNTVSKGVFIQHIGGSIHTKEEWAGKGFSNDLANGIVVVGENCQFVIAKSNVSYKDGMPGWGSKVLVNGIMTTTSSDEAFTDFAGEDNTIKIIEQITMENCAARQCSLYTFPNGANGYLPSLGEWKEAFNYKDDVDAAMSQIGGRSLGEMWTSTQYDTEYAWRFRWSSGDPAWSYYTKAYTGYFYCRPFTSL